jgi:hypothetical protein
MLAIGIIGGMADWVPAGAAEMAGVPPTCIAVPAAVTGGAAPVQADGTVSAPTDRLRGAQLIGGRRRGLGGGRSTAGGEQL